MVGGMVAAPVNFHGLAALPGMLNSCAGKMTVVNIDNGFGAGYAASLMNRSVIHPAVDSSLAAERAVVCHGPAALLGMLDSCARNVTVVNIDNDFGAGYAASLINRV